MRSRLRSAGVGLEVQPDCESAAQGEAIRPSTTPQLPLQPATGISLLTSSRRINRQQLSLRHPESVGSNQLPCDADTNNRAEKLRSSIWTTETDVPEFAKAFRPLAEDWPEISVLNRPSTFATPGPMTLTLTLMLCARMLRPVDFYARLRGRLYGADPLLWLGRPLLYCNKTKDSFTTEDNGLITSTTVGPDDASFNAGVARQNALAKVVRQNPDVITMIHVEGRRQCAGLDPELGPHVHRPPLRNFGPSTLM
ncbi:hypothetical protein Landi51_13761 [Colletotrichum acutatum]